MESPPRYGETLEHILSFLRSEGFYAAEDALRGEIENRLPEGSSPATVSPSSHQYPSAPRDRGFDPANIPLIPIDPTVAAHIAAQRQDSNAAASTTTAAQQSSLHSPTLSGTFSCDFSVSSRSHSTGSPTLGEVDEYSSDGDVGYVRKRVAHQQAFIARELDLSDEDGSARGTDLYHQAQAHTQSQWDDRHDGASSSGQGSSYVSREPIAGHGKDSPVQPQHSGAGSQDLGMPSSDKLVTVTAPVLPTGAAAAPFVPLKARKKGAHGAASSPQSLAEPAVCRMPSIGHELSPTASLDEEMDKLQLSGPEPIPAELPATPSAPPQPPPEPSSPLRYLDPLGMFGRFSGALTGQRRSSTSGAAAKETAATRTQASQALPSQPASETERPSSAVRASASEPAPPSSTEQDDDPLQELMSPFAASFDGSVYATKQHDSTCISHGACEPAVLRRVAMEPPGTPSHRMHATPDGSPMSTPGPHLPGEAFSFPVTPVADAPAPADTVFGAWPSFRKKKRQGGDRADVGTASSSGYTSDDEASEGGSLPHSLAAKLPTHGSDYTSNLQQVIRNLENSSIAKPSLSAPALLSGSAVRSQDSPAQQDAPRNESAASSMAMLDAAKPAGDSASASNPLAALKPLDMSISLPPLGCIDISSALMQKRRAMLNSIDREKVDAMNEVAGMSLPGKSAPTAQPALPSTPERAEHSSSAPEVPAAGQHADSGQLLSRAELQQAVRGEGDPGPDLQHRAHTDAAVTPAHANAQPSDGQQQQQERPHEAPAIMAPMARHESEAAEGLVYQWDEDWVDRRYEVLNLRVIHRRHRTGFEETKDFPIRVNDLVAGRYQVMDFLGSAAFSKAVQALDIKTGMLVCLKIVKNNKDYFDQSLDEIKLLRFANESDPADEHNLLRLYDWFYYKEHLFLVCELLRANLYEFQKYNRSHSDEPYFILPRVQRIARQVLQALAFMHSLDLIHSDLKPENILIKSYSRCEVKVIDLGSSCFTSDHLSSYVQSRSYRAPEVILGLPYDQKIDVWSLGCILAELLSGAVLLQNDSLATLLARMEGILGSVPPDMLRRGRFTHRFFTRSNSLYERSRTGWYDVLQPKRTTLRARVPEADAPCLAFLSSLLSVDPMHRPSSLEALQHPWLSQPYPGFPL